MSRSGEIHLSAVRTSKPEPFARQICDNLGIGEYFRTVCGDTMDGRRSTKELVLREVDRRLGGISRAAMVGDRVHDVEAAVHIGWTPIAVSWGYSAPGEFAEARHVVDDPEELCRVLGALEPTRRDQYSG